MEIISERFCTPLTSDGCGNGLCDLSGTTCVCADGYVHDYVQLLFPNCYYTQAGKIATLTVMAVACAVIACAGLYVRQGKIGLPKRMCEIAVISSICQICHMISLGVEGKPGIASIIFLMGVHVFGGCVAPFVFLWTLVSPTLDLMMLKHQHHVIVRRMQIFIAAFTIEQIGVFTAAVTYQYQGNFMKFNVIFSAQLAFIALYALLWLITVIYYSTVLFKKMDALLGSAGSGSAIQPVVSPTHSRITRHRKKLGLVVSLTVPLTICASVICATFAAIYFALGVRPYRFVVFILYMMLFPTFNVILIIFSARNRKTDSSLEQNNSRSDEAPGVRASSPRSPKDSYKLAATSLNSDNRTAVSTSQVVNSVA